MFRLYIQVGNQNWGIVVYYNVSKDDLFEIEDSLLGLNCPKTDIKKALYTLLFKNTGVTFSNDQYKMSMVCIAEASNADQFINTVVHEAKHVLSHICSYYDIKEDSEDAAYLIGHIVRQMYKMMAKVIRLYVRRLSK